MSVLRSVAIGVTGDIVASFAVYCIALAAEGAPAEAFIYPYWAALASIGAWSTLSVRRAAAGGPARDIVTALSAAFFTLLLAFGVAISYGAATSNG